MNTHALTRYALSKLLIACAVFALLISACQPANVATSLPTVQPTAAVPPSQPPTAIPVVVTTQTPVQATQPPSSGSGDITLDLSGAAQSHSLETVAAVPANAGAFWTDVLPEYRRVTLQGYPVTSHLLKPQIFVYPVADLAGFNEGAGRIVTDLQALLQAQQPVDSMPFLPLFNANQALHARVQYLDFQNGKGVRFLTQYDQGPMPINNNELIYTFQGLTSDGKYYVAAVLPVTHPELPATQQVDEQLLKDFPAYLAKTSAWLAQQPSGSFTPDLSKLDALIQSIEVK